MYSAALYHSLLLYNSRQLTYYWAHVEVKQASRHHVMRASRDVVNYVKQCSSLVSLSRSPSPHHPPLRPRHHVSIPGQHILHVTCICHSCYIYFSRLLHAFIDLLHIHHPHQTPIKVWSPCLNPRSAHPSRNCQVFVPPILSLRPFENHEGGSILIIRLPPYPHRDTFCMVIQHHMGILVMTY